MSNKPEKILLIAYACAPDKGAEPGNGWGWAVHLAKKGYNVWCLTNIEDKEYIISQKEKSGLTNLEFVFVSLNFGLDKKLLNTSSKKIYIHYALWQHKAFSIAEKLHQQQHFDIAHHVSFGSMQQGTFIGKLKHVKKIFGPVGGGQRAPDTLKQYFGKAWRTEQLRSFISGYSVKYSSRLKNTVLHCDHILVSNLDTAALAKQVKGCNPQKIDVVADTCVPLSMNNLPFLERKESPVLNLLWLARLLPRKGLQLILHALSFLPKDLNYKITIVGDGEQAALIESWINIYQLDRSKLIFTGQVPYSTLNQYYTEADVFIMCALRDSFGSQILEAMCFSLPIITLDHHGAALWVPDECGIKVRVSSAEDTAINISKAILKMYHDVDFRKSCAINAYHYSKLHTWENRISQVTKTFYQKPLLSLSFPGLMNLTGLYEFTDSLPSLYAITYSLY